MLGNAVGNTVARLKAEAPCLRASEVTELGHSVLAHIHGFEPYFFVECPKEMVNLLSMPVSEALGFKIVFPGSKQSRHCKIGLRGSADVSSLASVMRLPGPSFTKQVLC